MKKLLAKIIGATTALAMAIGMGFAIGNNSQVKAVDAAPGDETNVPTESFDSEDYSSGTGYQGTVTEGPENGTWTVYYGCFSTSSAITGTRSAAIRLYTTNNYGYLKTNFGTDYVSKVSFRIKAAQSNSARINVNVQYSTDNSTWSFMKQTSASGSDYNAVLPGTSASLVTAYMPTAVSGNQESVYLKWSIDSSSTKPSKSNSQLTIDDITIYYIEHAVAGTYSVTFDSKGGSTVPTQNVSNSGSATATEPSPAPTKSGYNFGGWYSDEELTDPYIFSTAVTSDITLYAKWTKVNLTNTYSVSSLTNGNSYRISGEVTAKTAANTFFIQDGNNSMMIYDNTVGGLVSVGNVVDLFGTYQNGNFAEIKNVVYHVITSDDTENSQTPLTSIDDATEANRYKYFEIPKLQLDSGFTDRKASIKNSSAVVFYNNADYVNVGGTFTVGDYSANDYVSIKGVVNKYDSTIELQIVNIQKLSQHTVTFHFNDGVTADSIQMVVHNDPVEEPVDPTRPTDENNNYSFAGWYDNSELEGSVYDFNTPVETNTHLYAKWNSTPLSAKQVIESTLTTRTALSYKYEKTGNGAVDTLNNENTIDSTGTTYNDWTNDELSSNVSYTGKSAGQYTTIQLRTKNSNEGIIVTDNTSNHDVANITIKWDTHTSAGRSINIYGKNTAYSETTDLYSGEESVLGTMITTLAYDSRDGNNETSYTFTSSYKFIGIRSSDSALFVESINIQWGELPTYHYSDVIVDFGGFISQTLWNRLDSESHIERYGVIYAPTSYLTAEHGGTELKNYVVDGTNVKNVFTDVPTGKTNPYEYGENYVWSLGKRFTEGNLTTPYSAVAYIVTRDHGTVFFNQTSASPKSLAQALIDDSGNSLNGDSYGGSLGDLAGK